jgi:hypothetical protein
MLCIHIAPEYTIHIIGIRIWGSVPRVRRITLKDDEFFCGSSACLQSGRFATLYFCITGL